MLKRIQHALNRFLQSRHESYRLRSASESRLSPRGDTLARIATYSAAPPLVAPCFTPPFRVAPSLIANKVLLFEMNKVLLATTGVL
jgi:hypothetical protein